MLERAGSTVPAQSAVHTEAPQRAVAKEPGKLTPWARPSRTPMKPWGRETIPSTPIFANSPQSLLSGRKRPADQAVTAGQKKTRFAQTPGPLPKPAPAEPAPAEPTPGVPTLLFRPGSGGTPLPQASSGSLFGRGTRTSNFPAFGTALMASGIKNGELPHVMEGMSALWGNRIPNLTMLVHTS